MNPRIFLVVTALSYASLAAAGSAGLRQTVIDALPRISQNPSYREADMSSPVTIPPISDIAGRLSKELLGAKELKYKDDLLQPLLQALESKPLPADPGKIDSMIAEAI